LVHATTLCAAQTRLAEPSTSAADAATGATPIATAIEAMVGASGIDE
jgi:hypothetical protein